MSSDIDSAASVHADDPLGLPFDPPGSVRMTAELRYKHTDDRRPIVNQYLRGHRVGRGQHGEVWVCWDLSDNRRELVSSQYFFVFEILLSNAVLNTLSIRL
jgi:hypothetical protein